MKYFDYCKKYRLELFTIESYKRFKRFRKYTDIMAITKLQ